MKKLILLIIFFFFPISITAQQIIDSANTITVDNLSDNNTQTGDYSGTLLNDLHYKEYPPDEPGPTSNGWWTNNGGTAFGGNHRRASRDGTGNLVGSKAVFSFDVPVKDDYIVYHYLQNSGNSSTKVLTRFLNTGEETPVKELYYNQRNHNLNNFVGSWYLLGMADLNPGDSRFSVELQIDTPGTGILRVDAVRILRSSQTGPDIEFASRRGELHSINQGDTVITSSFNERAPLEFPVTIYKWNGFSEKEIPVYNPGSSDLIIEGYNTSTSRFSITTPLPVVIPPGGETNLTIRFSPLGEEHTVDTLIILNNDALEPEAKLPLVGEGINYNFIMNASVGGTEPHWNAPEPGYEEIGTFISSAISPFPYPIPNGNLRSVVNNETDLNAAVIFKFSIPDSLAGNYNLEYSGPAGSSSSPMEMQADIITPGYLNPDTTLADTQKSFFNPREINSINIPWGSIRKGEPFIINGGGQTKVILRRTQAQELLRADLLRVKLSTTAPELDLNLEQHEIGFDSVSVIDSIRLIQNNFQKELILFSVGEMTLRIDSIYLSTGTVFNINVDFIFPVNLQAVDGKLDIVISFEPEEEKFYSDTLFIKSNDKDSLAAILLSGYGTATVVGINEPHQIPLTFSLEQNHPNPFNPSTEIKFSLPQSAFVELKIYDVLGNEIKTLICDERNAGIFTIEWNGKNNNGAQVSSGMYIYRISSGNFIQTKKMMFLK